MFNKVDTYLRFRVHKYWAKWTLTNGWTQRERSSTDGPRHHNTVSSSLFILLPSTHQLNVLPLAGSGPILAPYRPSPSLFLNEILFNLQEMFPLMGYWFDVAPAAFISRNSKRCWREDVHSATHWNYAGRAVSCWTVCPHPPGGFYFTSSIILCFVLHTLHQNDCAYVFIKIW